MRDERISLHGGTIRGTNHTKTDQACKSDQASDARAACVSCLFPNAKPIDQASDARADCVSYLFPNAKPNVPTEPRADKDSEARADKDSNARADSHSNQEANCFSDEPTNQETNT